jgi:acylphosphatase
MVRAHILISGLVQGIGYRWFTERRARIFGLTGYVRNLYDNRVEVVAEGERGLIEEFIKELRIGPAMANIREIKVNWEDYTGEFEEFRIRF